MEPSWPKIAKIRVRTPPLSDLKLNLFSKWRLGGLQARFWRPQGSILEPPGLDFGASRLDCGAAGTIACFVLLSLALSCFLLLSLAVSCFLLLSLACCCLLLLPLAFSCFLVIHQDSSCAFRSIATQVLPLSWVLFSLLSRFVALFFDFLTHLKPSCVFFYDFSRIFVILGRF